MLNVSRRQLVRIMRRLALAAWLILWLTEILTGAGVLSERTIQASRILVESRSSEVLENGSGESVLFQSQFHVPADFPTFLILETRSSHTGRLIVHFEPDQLPTELEKQIPEKDWANPERREDFRVILSLQPGPGVRHVIDLNREVFEAVSREKLPFDLAGLNIDRVAVGLERPAERDLRVKIRRPQIVSLTPKGMARDLEERASPLRKRWRSLPGDSPIRASWQPLVGRLFSQIRTFGRKPENSGEWRRITAELERLILASRKWTLPGSADKSYLTGIENCLRRVSGRHPLLTFQGVLAHTVELEAAANEYECFQIVLLPVHQTLRSVQLEVEDLRATRGSAMLPAASIQLFHEIDQRVLPSLGTSAEWAGWMPDALLPVRQQFDVRLEETKPIWVSVRTPESLPAGDYEGLLRIRPGNSPETAIRLKLKVHNFAIPTKGRFRTQGHLSLEGLRDWYGQGYSAGTRKNFYRLLIDHRMTPTSQYSARLSPDPEDIPWIAGRGGNVFLIGGYSGRALEPEVIQPAYDWLVEHGYVDRAILYIGDETDDFEEVRRKAREIRQKWPKIRIMVGGSKPRTELIDFVDVWDPITWGGEVYNFESEGVDEALKRGEEVFWYTCVGPRMPFANLYNDHPLTAIRALWWQAWKHGVTGFEYWWFNWWQPNLSLSRKDPPWPDGSLELWNSRSFEWANGDGLLVFPGSRGEALASLRLAVIRDAIEDWEVLFLLQRALELAEQNEAKVTRAILARARRLLSVPPEITTGLPRWTRSPAAYLEARHDLYATLSDLVEQLGRRPVLGYAEEWEKRHEEWLQSSFENRVRRSLQ